MEVCSEDRLFLNKVHFSQNWEKKEKVGRVCARVGRSLWEPVTDLSRRSSLSQSRWSSQFYHLQTHLRVLTPKTQSLGPAQGQRALELCWLLPLFEKINAHGVAIQDETVNQCHSQCGCKGRLPSYQFFDQLSKLRVAE